MKYTIGSKVFGDWEIVAELGEGSFGKVYRLEKNTYKIKAASALKVLTVPRSASEVQDALAEGYDECSVTEQFHEIVEKLVDEIAVMAELKSHPHIVSVEDYTVIEHETSIGWDILIRMELLTSLQDHQRMNPMGEAEVRQLAMDICEALIFCQEKKLIHRDIKPGNVFVDSLGQYKLGDFGVARTAEKTMSGLSKQGTENYMAPEVYFGRDYGPNVDIYSLGMMLYRLMNKNRLPFYPLPPAFPKFKEKEQALTRRLKGEALPLPCDASPDFAQIILKACEADPGKRYRTAAEMLKDLHREYAGEDENEKTLECDDENFGGISPELIRLLDRRELTQDTLTEIMSTQRLTLADMMYLMSLLNEKELDGEDISFENKGDEDSQGSLDQYLLNDPQELSMQEAILREDSTDRMHDHSIIMPVEDEDDEDVTISVFGSGKHAAKTIMKDQDKQKKENKTPGIDIAELGLTVRTYNILKRENLNTVEELCAMTASDLRDINNLGPRALADIQDRLSENGLKLSAGKSRKQLWRENKSAWMLEYWKKHLIRIYRGDAKLPNGTTLSQVERKRLYFGPDIPASICSDAIFYITERHIQKNGKVIAVRDGMFKTILNKSNVLGILDLTMDKEKPCTRGVVVTADAIYLQLGGTGKDALSPMVIRYDDFVSGWTKEAGGLLKSKRTVLFWNSRQYHQSYRYESSMSDCVNYDVLLECLLELSKKHK